MIAIAATAAVIWIAGAIANSHGTAVSGAKRSFDSSFSTSAIGCMRPRKPTRLGP